LCGLASVTAQRVKPGDPESGLAKVQEHGKKALDAATASAVQAGVHVAQGIAYLKAEQWEKAEQELKAAITAQPGHLPAYLYLADAYEEDAKRGEASTTFDEAKLNEAITVLEEAVAWRPGFEDAYFRLGRIYEKQQRAEEAKAAYSRAPSISEAHNSLGEILARQQEYDDALREFHAAVQKSKRDARAWGNLAWWTVEAGKHDEASLREATDYARRALDLTRGKADEWLSRDRL